MNAPHFILAGNGPYTNRGCEAIVRGTMEILRKEFGGLVRVTAVSFASRVVVDKQAAAETDSAITHIAHDRARGRWSADWIHLQFMKCLHPFSDISYQPRDLPGFLAPRSYNALDAALTSADAVLQIGGDNYSLDYGWPEPFLALDRHIQRRHRPIVLWGASVGPFDEAPLHAQNAMTRHLSSMRAILVRESASLAFLQRQALTNVFSVADPAFAMVAQKPDESRIGFCLPKDFIGMNFSPLMARYVSGGDMSTWIALCTEIVARTLKTVRRRIVLIPHVTHGADSLDDLSLMHRIVQGLDTNRSQVLCVPGTLSAPETKWIIAQSAAFVGARTHATIAAMSSNVPTLSLAYSRKAVGLNQDVFGSQDYSIQPADLASPDKVVARLDHMMTEAESIRRRLRQVTTKFVERAFAAGPLLRKVLSDDVQPNGETV